VDAKAAAHGLIWIKRFTDDRNLAASLRDNDGVPFLVLFCWAGDHASRGRVTYCAQIHETARHCNTYRSLRAATES
jgi:hypothetical protein